MHTSSSELVLRNPALQGEASALPHVIPYYLESAFSTISLNYQSMSSSETKNSFYYECNSLSMQDFDSFFATDGQKELLYALASYKPNIHKEKDPDLGVPANIVTG